jgi:hypothetical protein
MPRPVLAPARRLVPETVSSATAVPRDLTLSVPAVVTAWPSPRIRANRNAHLARDGPGVVITVRIDRDVYDQLRAHVARQHSRTLHRTVSAALRAWLRRGGLDA